MIYSKRAGVIKEPKGDGYGGRSARCPDRRGLGMGAGLAGLVAGTLCLAAACGASPSSTTTAATGSTPTPAHSMTQPSSPAATTSAASSPGGGSIGSVTGRPATSTEVAKLTAAAQDECGFTSDKYILTQARVTNNGWAMATVTARNPIYQGNTQIIFHFAPDEVPPAWTFNTCGSDFNDSGIPDDVLKALEP